MEGAQVKAWAGMEGEVVEREKWGGERTICFPPSKKRGKERKSSEKRKWN